MYENYRFQTVNIPRGLKQSITDSVVKKLKLKDSFQLNDRLDGIYYLNRNIFRIYSCFCIQKIFNIQLTYNEKPLFTNQTFKYNNLIHTVVPSKNMDEIKIPQDSQTNIFLVVLVNEISLTTQYLGMISDKDCERIKVSNKVEESINYITKKKQITINSNYLR